MDSTKPAPVTGKPQVFRDSPLLALRRMLLPALGGLPVVLLLGWFFFGRDLGMLVFFLVAAGLGIGGYLAFRPSITLVCTPDDFTLIHRNIREVFYLQAHPWRNIVRAHYQEIVQHRHRNGRVTTSRTRTFAIDLSDGYGVTFTENTTDFHELIATVGARTTHLPYLWFPAQRYIGRVAEQGGDYDLVPRAVVETQQTPVA